MNKRKGFTIVELLIVIVVIGILAGIAIVAYSGIQARAYNTKMISDARQLKTVLKMYHIKYGAIPTTSTTFSASSWGSACLGTPASYPATSRLASGVCGATNNNGAVTNDGSVDPTITAALEKVSNIPLGPYTDGLIAEMKYTDTYKIISRGISIGFRGENSNFETIVRYPLKGDADCATPNTTKFHYGGATLCTMTITGLSFRKVP